ncbi:MAG: hypothetical protein GY757_21180 [bacterium]|nr:hypothetical protein [bacterium]
MKNIDLWYERLKDEVRQLPAEARMEKVIDGIVHFYMEHFHIKNNEVAIFLINKSKNALYFVYPSYLRDSDEIPVDSTTSMVSKIYRTGDFLLENHVLKQEHLANFEFVKNPNDESNFIWKMIGALISDGNEKLGAIEISHKRQLFRPVGSDFTDADVAFLEETCRKFAPLIREVM